MIICNLCGDEFSTEEEAHTHNYSLEHLSRALAIGDEFENHFGEKND